MFDLPPLRHISTLRDLAVGSAIGEGPLSTLLRPADGVGKWPEWGQNQPIPARNTGGPISPNPFAKVVFSVLPEVANAPTQP
jgi:hypothetical protein